jgi:hypothetical protein
MKELLSLKIPGPSGPVQINTPEGIPSGGLSTPEGQSIIPTILTLVVVVAIVFALLILILSGINWIMSQGDKQKIETARSRIIYTIIGLFVIFLSWAIINALSAFFGIDLLNNCPAGFHRQYVPTAGTICVPD